MDPRAFRVAEAFVREHLRRARYAPEFMEWTQGRTFRNPDTGNEVLFVSLPDPEQAKIYRQWAAHRIGPPDEERARTRSPEEVDRRNAEIGLDGEVVESEILSPGGEPGAYNQSEIVKLRHGGEEQVFIRKPAEGEEKNIRVGIPAGAYHAREAGTYGLDRLVGGRPIVPVTVTRGNDDGSYQVWVQGARPMYDDALDDLVGKVKPEELHRSPDFHRLNALDLVMGHEDRHAGNLLYWFEGDEETPENLRFVAIDNGLTAAVPSETASHRVYFHPFKWMWIDDETKTDKERQEAADDAMRRGNRAVADSLSRIGPELHEQLKQVDLADAAKTLTSSGVAEEGAIRALLVRLAAVQENPRIFEDFLERSGGDLEKAWQEFQHASGQRDDLLRRAGAMTRRKEIDEAVEAARPEGGWTEPQGIENMFRDLEKELDGFDSWGIFEVEGAEAETRRGSTETFTTIWWLTRPGR